MNSSKVGHVYLIRAKGTNRYKIGMTSENRMDKRMKELNGAQSAYPLELVKVIDVSDRFEVEAELHQRFQSSRKHGEWFELLRGSSEVEKAMNAFEEGRTPNANRWVTVLYLGLMSAIAGLLFAWESKTNPPLQRSPQVPTVHNNSPK